MLDIIVADLFSALIGGAALASFAYTMLRQLFGEMLPLIGLGNTGGYFIWLGSMLLLLIAAVAQRWVYVALLLPNVLLFFCFYLPQFMPKAARPAQVGDISILTYNLLKMTSSQGKADVILAAQADIVLLQELTSSTAALFEERFRDLYPYRAFYSFGEEDSAGQGIMSRYPISESEYWHDAWLDIGVPITLSGHQSATIHSPHGDIALFNSHTLPTGFYYGIYDTKPVTDEVRRLVARTQTQQAKAVILAGDFNVTELSHAYRHVRQSYRDAFRDAGWGMGWTRKGFRDFALFRIDYVFYRGALEAVEARVFQQSGESDHYPLLVRLRWRDEH